MQGLSFACPGLIPGSVPRFCPGLVPGQVPRIGPVWSRIRLGWTSDWSSAWSLVWSFGGHRTGPDWSRIFPGLVPRLMSGLGPGLLSDINLSCVLKLNSVLIMVVAT